MEWPKTFNEVTRIKNPTITYNALQEIKTQMNSIFNHLNKWNCLNVSFMHQLAVMVSAAGKSLLQWDPGGATMIYRCTHA